MVGGEWREGEMCKCERVRCADMRGLRDRKCKGKAWGSSGRGERCSMRGRISPITSAFELHDMKGGHVVHV